MYKKQILINLKIIGLGIFISWLPSIAFSFNIGDTVKTTINLNVRTGAGTSYPEITDPDYPGYTPAGTIGKILDGPSSANGYIWWKVDYGPGLYTGWSIENGLTQTWIDPPTHISPANGATNVSLTPILQWNSVSGADRYALFISKPPYGEANLVYENYNLTDTSITVPSGTLKNGVKYCWNMASHGSLGWSYDRTDGGKKYSDFWAFTTLSAQTWIDPPTHISPANGATNVSLTPTLQWNSVSGADRYALFISEPPYGETHLVYENYNLTGTSIPVPSGTLKNGVKYSWNMASHGSLGWSYDRTDGGKKYSDSWAFTTLPAQTGSVTLTLYVHEGSADGPILSGARVTGNDATDNSFDQTTNSSGYVIITGAPGAWHFSASKSGYQTNTWDQNITETCRRDACLQKSEPPPSAKPVIISPLVITPKDTYFIGDVLTATFAIKNVGNAPITLSVLTVGGRDPDGIVVDFEWKRDITLDPKSEYTYLGKLILPYSVGDYHFFCAYQTPDGNWNTSVDIGEGLIDNDRTKDIIVSAKYYLIGYPHKGRGGIVIPEEIFPEGKGEVIPIFVPSVDNDSNAMFNNGDWQTIKKIEKNRFDFDWAEFFASFIVPGPPENQYINAPMSAFFSLGSGFLMSASQSTAITTLSVTIQKNSKGKMRAILQLADVDLNTSMRSLAGKGWQTYNIEPHWYYISKPIYEAFHLEPDTDYWMFFNIDSRHKDDEFIGYLSFTQDNKLTFTPKIYSNDGFKVTRGRIFSTDIFELYGDGYLSLFERAITKQMAIRIAKILASVSISIVSEPGFLSKVKSPGELRVYDSQNRITGLFNRQTKEEIPNSVYNEQNKSVIIFFPSDTYRYEVIGTDLGTYGLTAISVSEGTATTFTATNIPTSANVNHQYTIDWSTISQGSAGVTLKIDANGDGLFEQQGTITHNEFTQQEFLSLPPPQVGTLTITTTPEGAEIYIDNVKMVQTTPATLGYIPAGTRIVNLSLHGYNKWAGETTIIADETTKLQATLTLANLNIIAYPNPCSPGKPGHDKITFQGVTDQCKVRIYNIIGELIYEQEFTNTNGKVEWDLKNQSGEKVASGIYIYVITNPAGEKGRGKIGIIR